MMGQAMDVRLHLPSVLCFLISAFPVAKPANAQSVYWTDGAYLNEKVRRTTLGDGMTEDLIARSGVLGPTGIAFSAQQAKLYIACGLYGRVVHANQDGMGIATPIATGLTDATFVAVDETGGKVYWVDAYRSGVAGRILRANLDGSNAETIVTADGFKPSGIALDLLEGRLYFATYGTGVMSRVNLDGSNWETFVVPGLGSPFGVALDPVERKLYWSDLLTRNIRRAPLNFASAETVVPAATGAYPAGIAIDPTRRHLYWVDSHLFRIRRSNLDGSGAGDFVDGDRTGFPAGIAVDADGGVVYWGDDRHNTVRKIGTDGTDYQVLFRDMVMQPGAVVLDPAFGVLYWTNNARDIGESISIRRMNLDGTNVGDLVSDLNRAWSIAVDPLGERVYWASTFYGGDILCAARDGSDVRSVVPIGRSDDVYSIALDPGAGKIYWARDAYNPNESMIQRRDIAGGAFEDLVPLSFGGEVRGLALDLAEGKMYFGDASCYPDGCPAIIRANLDGSGLEEVLTDGLGYPQSLFFEPVERKLYWTAAENPYELPDRMLRADPYGDAIEPINVPLDSRPAGLVVDACRRDRGQRIEEYTVLFGCLGGPDTPAVGLCHCADLSADARVDLRDIAVFQRAYLGP